MYPDKHFISLHGLYNGFVSSALSATHDLCYDHHPVEVVIVKQFQELYTTGQAPVGDIIYNSLTTHSI